MAYQNVQVKKVKITKSFTDFAVAAPTNDISIFTLPAKAIIHHVAIYPVTSFIGGDLEMTGYGISIGIIGDLDKYTGLWSMQPPILPFLSEVQLIESMTTTTDIRAAASGFGTNLNEATQGVVDMWIYYSVLD